MSASSGGGPHPPHGGVPQRRATDQYPMVPPKSGMALFMERITALQVMGIIVIGLLGALVSVTLWYSGVNANADKIKDMEPKLVTTINDLGSAKNDIKNMQTGLIAINTQIQAMITQLDARMHDSFVSVDTRLNDDRSAIAKLRDGQQDDRRQMDAADATLRGDLAVLAERVKGLIDRQPPLPLVVPSKSSR